MKMKNLKLAGFIAAILAIPALGYYFDPLGEFGTIRHLLNGAIQFTTGVTGGDSSLRVMNELNSTYAIVIDSNSNVLFGLTTSSTTINSQAGTVSGGLVLPTLTSTQVNAFTPKYTGELIFNSTAGTLCISSGTAQDQFVKIASGTPGGCIGATACGCTGS